MTNGAEEPAKRGMRLKPTYIPRLMPVGAAVILLMILIPVLREERRGRDAAPAAPPPLPMAVYATGSARVDTLMNEGLRLFGREEFDQAARLLAEAHFYWTVKMKEGCATRYPEDLRFYYGLAQFYRGRAELAAPFLEEEERDNAFEAKYPWYLAHIYRSLGRTDASREKLERVVSIGEAFADEARAELARIPETPRANGPR